MGSPTFGSWGYNKHSGDRRWDRILQTNPGSRPIPSGNLTIAIENGPFWVYQRLPTWKMYVFFLTRNYLRCKMAIKGPCSPPCSIEALCKWVSCECGDKGWTDKRTVRGWNWQIMVAYNHFVLERENLCKSHHQKGLCVAFAKNLVTLIKNPSGHIRPVEKQACKN